MPARTGRWQTGKYSLRARLLFFCLPFSCPPFSCPPFFCPRGHTAAIHQRQRIVNMCASSCVLRIEAGQAVVISPLIVAGAARRVAASGGVRERFGQGIIRGEVKGNGRAEGPIRSTL